MKYIIPAALRFLLVIDFSMFIIIDNPEHENSIVDLQSFSFLNGAYKAENYIEHFPFPYYLILKSVLCCSASM